MKAKEMVRSRLILPLLSLLMVPTVVSGDGSFVVEPASLAGTSFEAVPFVPCYRYFGTNTVFSNLTVTSNNLNRQQFQMMTGVVADPNVSSVVIVDAINGGGSGQGFFEYNANEAAARGFKAIIFRCYGDLSSASISALLLYMSFTCPLPVFLISQDFDDVILSAKVVTLQMIPNPEVPFIHGPYYIIFVTVPCYMLSIAVMWLSLRRIPYQLSRKPSIRNTALMVCICNFIQAAALFVITSWLLRTDIPASWIVINTVILTMGLASFASSFAISMKYHRILQGIYGPPAPDAPLSEKILTTKNAKVVGMISSLIMTVLEVLATFANSAKVIYLALACFSFAMSKFMNATYCFYTQKQMIKIYKDTTHSNQHSQERLISTARRLIIASLLNFLAIVIAITLGFRIYKFEHTWITFPYLLMAFCATGFLELKTQIRTAAEENEEKAKPDEESMVPRTQRAGSGYALWRGPTLLDTRNFGASVFGNTGPLTDIKEPSITDRFTLFWGTVHNSITKATSDVQPNSKNGSTNHDEKMAYEMMKVQTTGSARNTNILLFGNKDKSHSLNGTKNNSPNGASGHTTPVLNSASSLAASQESKFSQSNTMLNVTGSQTKLQPPSEKGDSVPQLNITGSQTKLLENSQSIPGFGDSLKSHSGTLQSRLLQDKLNGAQSLTLTESKAQSEVSTSAPFLQ
jgi:hypothetical protein